MAPPVTSPAAVRSVEERLANVRRRVEGAAARAGRDPGGVEIVAVTKGHPDAVVRAVGKAGLVHVGENRVGEAEGKLERLGRLDLCWHMIGHVQRKKAARAVRAFDEIESLDSLRLAAKLDEELGAAGRRSLAVLIQVNASGEASKGGFGADTDAERDETVDAVRRACEFPHLRVRGFMTMAPLTDDEDVLRRTFRRTRSLLERCRAEVPEFEGSVLSMGMSNDFEIAVEEGSTRLRLGTILVGERPKP